MKYQILEHPAELRLRIYGKTIEKLFIGAAKAMANILAKSKKRQMVSKKKERLKIESIDLNSLLVDFLSEILAKSQINKCIYLVSSLKLQAASLKAELIGYPIERFDEDIKAVTYYGVDIKKDSQGIWQTEIVFDI